MDAFATLEDLQTRLNRTFSEDQVSQIEKLLDDASTYLRDAIGQQVFPQSTATFRGWPVSGWVDLPQQPVISVASVIRDGKPVVFEERPDGIAVRDDKPVDVTFTYGYAEPPAGLTRWACVLVSQTLTTLEMNLGLSVGGLSSVGIDDFRAAFADGGEGTGMSLSPDNLTRLRDQYGSAVAVGGMR